VYLIKKLLHSYHHHVDGVVVVSDGWRPLGLEFDSHPRLILLFYFLKSIYSWNGPASSDLGRKRVGVGTGGPEPPAGVRVGSRVGLGQVPGQKRDAGGREKLRAGGKNCRTTLMVRTAGQEEPHRPVCLNFYTFKISLKARTNFSWTPWVFFLFE